LVADAPTTPDEYIASLPDDRRDAVAAARDVEPMTLAEWLDEYRAVQPDEVERREAAPIDDWEEPELLAPEDRLRDTTPRWRERAERVGYGRPTQL
jgi:hypothetical protein